jgi:hypothetical protein
VIATRLHHATLSSSDRHAVLSLSHVSHSAGRSNNIPSNYHKSTPGVDYGKYADNGNRV